MSGHGPHADASDPFQRRTAVAIALYTVILAFGNMLTNQARTEAILSSNRATNKWAHYQSKSTKQNLVRLQLELNARLPAQENAAEVQKHFEDEIERYDQEKEVIFKEADELANEEKNFERKENFYEYSSTIAELAIILAGVALLGSSRKLLGGSMAAAAASIVLLGYTAIAVGHGEVKSERSELADAEKPHDKVGKPAERPADKPAEKPAEKAP